MTEPRDFGLALIVVAHGAPLALCFDGPPHIVDHVRECFSCDDAGGFAFHDEVDFAPIADGVYIAELLLIDDGPGDWPGSREVQLQARNFRPVTAEDWTAHLNGEWPWEPFDVPALKDLVEVDEERSQRCTGCGDYADEAGDRCDGHGDAGHNFIDVDAKGMALPPREIGLSDESFCALLGDDE